MTTTARCLGEADAIASASGDGDPTERQSPQTRAGAMGVAFEAFDPSRDRRVAVGLLRLAAG